MDRPFRILGIDPGSHHTGWGVVEKRGNSLSLVGCGTISPSRSLPLAGRLAVIAAGIREVCERERPVAASVETVFHSVNPRTALVLGQARGAAFAGLGGLLPVHEYAPGEIKRAVTGNGRAAKEQVGKMVGLLLGGEAPEDEHACDALAAAICHINRSNALRALT